MLLLTLVLVTAGAVDLHALDLVFFLQVRLVHVGHLFGELDLLGLELVIRFAVAVGGHATGIDNPRPGLNRAAAEGDVGETLRRLFGNVFTQSLTVSNCNLPRLAVLPGQVMAFYTTACVVFVICPGVVALLYNARVRQNVAVTAEKLGFGGIGLGKIVLEQRLLVRCPRKTGKNQSQRSQNE
jgi:hypothetical protein